MLLTANPSFFALTALACAAVATPVGAQAVCPAFPQAGNALSFNGASSFVELSGSSLSSLNQLTFEAWVMPSALPAGANRIISNAGASPLFTLGFGLGQVNGGRLRFTRFGVADHDTPAVHLAIGQWTHVAVVYGSTASANFYVNGQPVGTVTIGSVGLPIASASNLTVGRNPQSFLPAEHWDGLIDEVRVWTVARTAQQILDNYDQVIAPQAGLHTYMRFSEGRGTTTADAAGSHTGTIVGATWMSFPSCLSPCPTDHNGDGVTNGLDLAVLLGAWGPCS